MAEEGRPRAYNSPLRERQAQETRTAVLDAAGRLFPEHGFARTRLADVAADAGVSLATVKLIFGTKHDLLLTLWHRTLAGGADDHVPVAERPWYQAVFEPGEPGAKLARLAEMTVTIRRRTAGIARVIEEAAAADEEIAKLRTRMSGEYHANQRAVIEDLESGGHLREELSVDEATDILFTLNSGHTYYTLVHLRGWTPEKYERWLATALERELVRPGAN